MSVDKTPLQKAIKEAIEKHPALDDKEIARLAFEARYPDEKYEGTDPTFAYVAKMRRRIEQSGEPPEFLIEPSEEPPAFELEEPEDVEPELPFDQQFEPPEEIEPFIDVDFTEGFTLDDTEFILCFTFDKFADWSGYDGWRFRTDAQGKLIDKNERRFAGLTHRMFEKYMPDLLDQYFMEFMFCYTGMMIVGSKAKGYVDWRRKRKPVLSKQTEKEQEPEEPTPDEPEPEEEPLPYGAKTKGEAAFMKRVRRQTP